MQKLAESILDKTYLITIYPGRREILRSGFFVVNCGLERGNFDN
jgi:hypothetical protein